MRVISPDDGVSPGAAPLPPPPPPAAGPSWNPTGADSGYNWIFSGATPDYGAIAGEPAGPRAVGAPPGPVAPQYGTPPPAAPAAPAAAPGGSADAQPPSPFLTDPGYLAALAQEQAGIPTINQGLNDAMTRLIVSYGDPSLAAQAGFGLDPQAAAFARQNYLSGNGALARLDHAHSQARQAIINRLAAHGLLQSGDTGYQEGQEDQSYGNNVYDAQQSVLNQILGLRQGALTDLQNLHGNTTSALQTAWQNFLDHPEAFGVTTGGTPGENPTPGGQTPSPNPPARTSARPPTQPSPKKAVVKQLANAYTSGRKARG